MAERVGFELEAFSGRMLVWVSQWDHAIEYRHTGEPDTTARKLLREVASWPHELINRCSSF